MGKELSFGEKLVGLTFNPSNDVNVQKAKAAYAAIIDDLNDQGTVARQNGDTFQANIFDRAIEIAVDAQMWAVKAITWKGGNIG